MERRYGVFTKAGCRDITSYNDKERRPNAIPCVIDELADLMISRKRCEGFLLGWLKWLSTVYLNSVNAATVGRIIPD